MKISNKTYDVLKWIAQIFLPALITLYGTVALAIGIPYTDIVITIIGAVDAFLGTLLGISAFSYNQEVAARLYDEFQKKKQLNKSKIEEASR